nr:putative metal-dependent hydrolase [candidate division Zixibacteria bacterium]
MRSVDERNKMIEKIRTLPQVLARTVCDLDDEQLDTPYGDGKWTVRQVVHHLADAHLNAFARMKLILTEDNPVLKTYDQDRWTETIDARQINVQSSLLILTGLHLRWCELMESLSEKDWSRSASHPEIGEVTMIRLLEIYSGHGENHLSQIKKLREVKNW